jgi:hypothetical protein
VGQLLTALGIFLVIAGLGTLAFESVFIGPLIIALGAVAIWKGRKED